MIVPDIQRVVRAVGLPYLDATVNAGTVVDAALGYAEAGLYVVPVATGTKNPGSILGKAWQEQSSRDPAVIARWYERHPDAGVAIHTGRSGLVVFDLDNDDLSALPPHIAAELRGLPFQRSRGTGDRGHYLARTTEKLGNSPGGFAPYGDVRGTNGVIVAAPTRHPETGEPYAIVRDGGIPPIPAGLRGLLRAPKGGSGSPEAALADDELAAFLASHASEAAPGRLNAPLREFRRRVAAGESRHTALISTLSWALRDARNGHYSAVRAVDEFRTEFLASFEVSHPGQRTRPDDDEFENAVRWAAAQPTPKQVANQLWEMSDVLRLIRRWAQEKFITPWSLLGVGLLRAITAIPPIYVLPPIIGGPASCNLFLGLVGESGSGKGLAFGVAATVFELQEPAASDVYPGKPATGEGIAKMFGSYNAKAKEVEYRCTRVSLLLQEVDFLYAMFQREGTSLSPILRELFSGETLGADYSMKENRVIVRQLRYRATLGVGMQPDHGGAIFADLTGGLAQRFVFVATQDREIADPTGETSDLHPIVLPVWEEESTDAWLTQMGHEVYESELVPFAVPAFVRDLVYQARRDKMRGQAGGLDGHRLLLLMKIALGFAVLHGGTDGFDAEHWTMADLFAKHSDATREDILSATTDAARSERDAKARAEGRAQIVRSEAADEERRASCRMRLRGVVGPEWISRSDIARKLSSAQRDVLDEVLGEMVASGELEAKTARSGDTDGTAYRKAVRS